MKSLIAIDNSGSTSNEEEYWTYAGELIKNDEQTEYVLWNTKATLISYAELKDQIDKRMGGGGTEPSSFINMLKNVSDLEIITDGEVCQGSVTQCDNLIGNEIRLNSVTIHIIGRGDLNLSVAAPFIRCSEHYKVITKYGKSEPVVLSQGNPLNLNVYRNDPERFIKEADDIIDKLTVENLGRNNVAARNELLELKKNLLFYLQKQNSTDYTSVISTLSSLLKQGNYEDAFVKTKEIVNCEIGTEKVIEQLIQRMITKCDGFGNFKFSRESNRLDRSKAINPDELLSTPNVEIVSNTFECPVYLENDIPVLLITKGHPVLANAHKKYQDALIDNPLLFLSNPKLVQALRNRVDCAIGLKAAKILFQNVNVKSPKSRRDISCFISVADEKSHREALRYSLANLFFGSKIVGLLELWLAVLYFVIEDIEYLANSNFTSELKTTLLSKLRNSYSTMSMSGLIIEPTLRCTVDIAIWYCVISPYIFEGGVENRLQHLITPYHLKLLDMFGYPYKKEWTEHQLCIYKAFETMMKCAKNNKREYQIILKASTYQRSITLSDGTIILVDGDKREFKTEFSKLTEQEIFFLGSLVDVTKKICNITVPNNIPNVTIPDVNVNYCYPLDLPEDQLLNYYHFPIVCKNTMRPYTFDTKTKVHWKVQSEEFYGPLNKQISLYNYFIKFVNEKNKYPENEEEYIKWVFKKQMQKKNSIDTLPINIIFLTEHLFNQYKDIMSTVTPDEFRIKSIQSMSKENRIQIEEETNMR